LAIDAVSATETTSHRIDKILLADSYLDGGSIAIVAITDNKSVLYVYSSQSQSEGQRTTDAALLDSINLLKNPKSFIKISETLHAWMLENLNGSTIKVVLKRLESDTELSVKDKNILSIHGFLQEVCAGHSMKAMFRFMADAGTCEKIYSD